MAHYSTKCVVFEIIVYRLDCLPCVLYRIRRRYREVVDCEYCVVLLVSVQPDMICYITSRLSFTNLLFIAS